MATDPLTLIQFCAKQFARNGGPQRIGLLRIVDEMKESPKYILITCTDYVPKKLSARVGKALRAPSNLVITVSATTEEKVCKLVGKDKLVWDGDTEYVFVIINGHHYTMLIPAEDLEIPAPEGDAGNIVVGKSLLLK